MSKELTSDIASLEQRFGPVDIVHDDLAGDGVAASFERESGDTVIVQLFPDTGIATIETRLMRLALRGAHGAFDEANDSLELRSSNEHGRVVATISQTGSVLITDLPSGADNDEGLLEEATNDAGKAETSSVGGGSGEPVSDAPESPDEPGTPDENEKNERVKLMGRVGTEPRFRTTKAGALVGTFPLAVHNEEGKTTWHTVVAFKERAEKLKDIAAKGAEIQVVGYVHTSEYTDNTGITKERKEVWASVVKPSKPKE